MSILGIKISYRTGLWKILKASYAATGRCDNIIMPSPLTLQTTIVNTANDSFCLSEGKSTYGMDRNGKLDHKNIGIGEKKIKLQSQVPEI